MSLGENSLVAAYQGRGQLKRRPSGTRVVTFIGASDGGIRDPTRKRLTGYGGYEIQRTNISLCSKRLVWRCGAEIKRLWRTQRDFILCNFLSRSGFFAVKFVCRLISSGRRLPSILRSLLTSWLIEDNGQRTNNGRQHTSSQRKGIKL